jgi:hypothetical protein
MHIRTFGCQSRNRITQDDAVNATPDRGRSFGYGWDLHGGSWPARSADRSPLSRFIARLILGNDAQPIHRELGCLAQAARRMNVRRFNLNDCIIQIEAMSARVVSK